MKTIADVKLTLRDAKAAGPDTKFTLDFDELVGLCALCIEQDKALREHRATLRSIRNALKQSRSEVSERAGTNRNKGGDA